MKITTIICLLIMISFAVSTAQPAKPYFEKDSKAMLFEFSGLAYLGTNSFNGGIGGKYFIKSDLAIRGSIQIASITEDDPFQGSGGVDGESHASQFGLSAAAEFHLNTTRINPYFGGGLAIRFTSTESKSAEQDANDQVTVKNSRSGEFGYLGGTEFVIFGMVGAEVFIIENLSLAAEYQLGFSHLSRKDEETSQGNTTTTNKQGSRNEFGIESSGMLTLAIYF